MSKRKGVPLHVSRKTNTQYQTHGVQLYRRAAARLYDSFSEGLMPNELIINGLKIYYCQTYDVKL